MSLKKFDPLHSALQIETSFIDFDQVRSLFLGHYDKVSKHKSTIQQKKFNNVRKDKKPHIIPRKLFLVILAMFYHVKGLNFSILLKNLTMLIT